VTAGSKRPPHHSTSGGCAASQGSATAARAIASANTRRAGQQSLRRRRRSGLRRPACRARCWPNRRRAPYPLDRPRQAIARKQRRAGVAATGVSPPAATPQRSASSRRRAANSGQNFSIAFTPSWRTQPCAERPRTVRRNISEPPARDDAQLGGLDHHRTVRRVPRRMVASVPVPPSSSPTTLPRKAGRAVEHRNRGSPLPRTARTQGRPSYRRPPRPRRGHPLQLGPRRRGPSGFVAGGTTSMCRSGAGRGRSRCLRQPHRPPSPRTTRPPRASSRSTSWHQPGWWLTRRSRSAKCPVARPASPSTQPRGAAPGLLASRLGMAISSRRNATRPSKSSAPEGATLGAESASRSLPAHAAPLIPGRAGPARGHVGPPSALKLSGSPGKVTPRSPPSQGAAASPGCLPA